MSGGEASGVRTDLPLRHGLVLAAGTGTRLWPLTLVRAKPAVPVAGEPMVRRVIRQLAAAGIDDLVLNLHHLPATLTGLVGDGSDLGVVVRYSWEHPVVLGSAGGPRHALPLIGAERFLVANGDTLTDADIGRLVGAHRRAGTLVTLLLTPNREPHRYGGVRLGNGLEVTGFVPRGPEADGSYHFTGLQVVEAEAFRHQEDGPVPSIGGLYDRLLTERPGSIAGLVDDCAFWDVGTVGDYWRTSMAMGALEQPAPATVRVHPTARVSRSILWDDIEIAAGCVLDECIVTDGVRAAPGSRYRRAVLVQTAAGVSATPIAVG